MNLTRILGFCVLGIVLTTCQISDDIPGPSDFELSYPANNESDLIPGFEFKWEESSHAISYELHIGNDKLVNDWIIADVKANSKAVEDLRYGKTYYWQVLAFDDAGNSKSSSTYTFSTKKNYKVLDENFFMPQLERSRKVSVYLPPNYENDDSHYPVLYMHDGQALFDTENYEYEEWEVDETLDRLYQENGIGFIVVGVDYGEDRLTEYSPWVNSGEIEEWAGWSSGLGGLGDEYMEFIVNTLKPHIDEEFRTLPDKDNTAIIGSSMGGLISCYAGLQYPDVFGNIGVYSPSFWFSEGGIYELAEANAAMLDDNKFYFLAGDSETTVIDLSTDMQQLIDILLENNVESGNLIKIIVPNGTHEEYLWREEFEKTIRWMFIEDE